MNEAFIHMLATLYKVNIVIFSDEKFGPNKYLKMMLYEPGLKEQSEIFLRGLKELLAQTPATYCIHYARAGTRAAHFSLMKMQPVAAFQPDIVDVRSPSPSKRKRPLRRLATSLEERPIVLSSDED